MANFHAMLDALDQVRETKEPNYQETTRFYDSIFGAAARGDIEVVFSHLKRGTFHIDDGDEKGWTALHHAAFNGHKDLCFGLVWNEYSIDMLRIRSLDGFTPLACAAQAGHTELCVAFASCYGSDQLNAMDEDGRRIEEIAICGGKINTAITLAETVRQIEERDSFKSGLGQSPKYHTCQRTSSYPRNANSQQHK